MIRRLLISSSLLLFLSSSDDCMNLNEAQEFASRYYNSIENIVKTGKGPTSEDEYIRMFGRDSKGNPLYTDANKYPNYLYLIDKGGDWEQNGTPETILGDIEEFIHSHRIGYFKYRPMKPDYCWPPQLTRKGEKPTFAMCPICTEWKVNNERIVIDDTVFVNLKDKNISRICNKILPLVRSSENTLEDMLAKAEMLYSTGDYKKAEALYLKVLEKYPDNDDALYYLGVMYLLGDVNGGKRLSTEARMNIAYKYFKKSHHKQAKRGLHIVTHGRE